MLKSLSRRSLNPDNTDVLIVGLAHERALFHSRISLSKTDLVLLIGISGLADFHIEITFSATFSNLFLKRSFPTLLSSISSPYCKHCLSVGSSDSPSSLVPPRMLYSFGCYLAFFYRVSVVILKGNLCGI